MLYALIFLLSFGPNVQCYGTSVGANRQMVKNLSTMQETQVQSLGWKDLEEEMATHSNILAWKILWTEEPGRPDTTDD